MSVTNAPANQKFDPEAVAGLTRQLDSVMDKTIHAIDCVNDQIRVLALNARIEAARAGEAGKAFNIVAMEIAGLSNNSAKVVNDLKHRSGRTLARIGKVSKRMATEFNGTRLSDLALMNIDLIDRNLYERSCDVRWWATDASLVSALTNQSTESFNYASKRMGVILDSYTVYYDLVLCDLTGRVVANGRPELYRSQGTEHSHDTWFQSALRTRSGKEFGFQSVHRSPLAGDRLALVYSCVVREEGDVNGKPLGVLGIVFNWEGLAQTIVHNVGLTSEEKSRTRVCIVDDTGAMLADSRDAVLRDVCDFPNRSQLFSRKKDFLFTSFQGKKCCIAHALSPGFETYATGWHSVLIQESKPSAAKKSKRRKALAKSK